MPKGLTDAQLNEFIKKLDSFEQKQGSFSGDGLTIEQYTGGKAKDIPSLKKLIQNSYLPKIKEEIGKDFNNIETPIIFELLDYKFNTGRSVSDLASFSIGDSTLDQVNKSSNLKVSDWSKLNLDNLTKAKDQVYKTTNGYTLENPNPAYYKTWKNRIGSTQDSTTYKDSINNRLKNKGTGVKEDVSAQGDVSNKENVSIQENKDMAEGETLKKQQEVVIGDRTITITDPYGIRGQNFKNREGQHSKGIDLTTDNQRVISLTDGVVEVAKLEGSPTLVSTGKEKSGGYYLIVKNDDGTRSQYMHLDAMTPQEQKDIIGKRVKRGDDIGGYGVGSGSGTGPHVKYRVFTGEVGTQRKTHIDPSVYITGNNETGNEIKLIQDNELITEGKDKGWYKTTLEKPDGSKQTIKGKDPFTKITIGNNEYFKSGDFYNMFDPETGNVEIRPKRINDVYESELVALEKKVKDGKHLNKKELQIAESIYDFKEEEFNNKIDSLKEGFVDDDRKKGVKNKEFYREQIEKNKERFYNKILKPEQKRYIKEDLESREKEIKRLEDDKLTGSSEEIKTKRENLKKIKEQYKKNRLELVKDYNTLVRDKTGEIYKEGIYATPTKGGVLRRHQLVEKQFTDLKDKLYNKKNIPEDKEEEERIAQEGKEKQPILGGLDNQSNVNRGTLADGTTGGTLADGTTVPDVDPNGMINKDEDLKEIAPYIDEEYLLNQNALDQETIDFIRNQKEFNAELPEQEEDYDNILGNIADIGKGVVGLAGAMEDVPEYQTGDMYNEYTEDARRLKDQGLSKEEIDFMKSNAERAFGFGMQQFRGAGASSALVGAGQQAAILAGQSAKIAALDQGVRRQNRQYFANAAVADENINRQKFEDKFTQSMLNKKEGAALARDAYTNMNERAQFEKQYGKDSQYQQLMNENILSMREARENKKRSQANQKETSINKLKQQILDRQAKMKKTA